MSVPLPITFAGLSHAIPLADLDLNFNALNTALSGAINMENYGVKGDGSDETTRIQAAFNDVPPIGGWLIVPPPATWYGVKSPLIWSGHQGGGILGPGTGPNRMDTFCWIGAAGGNVMYVTKSQLCDFRDFGLAAGYGSNKAAIPLLIESDNAPAVTTNVFRNISARDGTTAGVNIRGKTTNQEQNDFNLFENLHLYGNKVQFWQESGNAQGTLLLGGVMMAANINNEATCEVDYNVKLGGGSLAIYGTDFEGSKQADILVSYGGCPGVYPGLAVSDVYSESCAKFLDFGQQAFLEGGIALQGIFHKSSSRFTTAAGQGLRVDGFSGGRLTAIACTFPGDLVVTYADQEVVCLNVDLLNGGVFSVYPEVSRFTNLGGNQPQHLPMTGDIVMDLSTKGPVYKDTQSPAHYWRQTVSNAGVPVLTDLGTVRP